MHASLPLHGSHSHYGRPCKLSSRRVPRRGQGDACLHCLPRLPASPPRCLSHSQPLLDLWPEVTRHPAALAETHTDRIKVSPQTAGADVFFFFGPPPSVVILPCDPTSPRLFLYQPLFPPRNFVSLPSSPSLYRAALITVPMFLLSSSTPFHPRPNPAPMPSAYFCL